MVVSEIVSSIVDAFTELLTGAAQSIVSLFQVLFMVPTTSPEGAITYSGISDFGIWTLAFIGIGAAMGILAGIRNKVLSK